MSCPHSAAAGPCALCAAAPGQSDGELPTVDGGLAATAAPGGPSGPSGPVRDVLGRGGKVGRYVVHDIIGQGGMGIIYTAYDPQLDRQIALKLLRTVSEAGTEDSGGQARLLREAQAMAQLSHPNVLPVYDVGPYGSSVFVAMELVRGVHLGKWIKQQPRGWREILDLFLQAGQGLHAAHEAGLVHRDFKPANVLIGEDGRARVADFGIARSTRASERPGKPPTTDSGRVVSLDTPLTIAGSMLGSPGYMAPEQYAGVATSPATDQFAFCIALYEGLYGVRPFSGANLNELAHATNLGRIPPAPKGSPVPAWIHRVIEQGLAVDPAKRHPSMAALLFALSNDPARVVRRRATIALAVLGLVAGGTFLGWLQVRQARVCRGAELKLKGVWDEELKARAGKAFEATGKSYAGPSWANARDALDAYARQWTAARTETCEATRIRGEQTEAQLLLRMTCLDRRLDELGALASAFTAADTSVLDQSAAAVTKLSPLDGCANLKGLQERRQVPPEAQEAVARLGQALAQGRALVATGKFAQARERIAPALVEATQLKLPGPQAEAQATLGELESEASNWAAARDAFEKSVRFAQAAADDETAARSLASLVTLVGWRLERPAEGRTLASIALGIVERMGGDERVEAKLAESLGDAEWQAGERKASLAGYRKALAAMIRLQGSDSADVARLRSSVGWVLMEQGELTESRKEFEQSRAIREKVLGPDHPSLASTWNELGSLADSLGDAEEAVRCMERGLAVELLAVGDDSVGAIRKKLGLAEQLRKADRAAEAFVFLRQAEATLARHPEASPSTRMQAERIAAVLEAAQGRHAEAVKAARKALLTAEIGMGKDHPYTGLIARDLARSLAELKLHAEALENYDRYLGVEDKVGGGGPEYAIAIAESARPLLALGRTKEALARLERAVALMPWEKGNHPRAALVHFALADALWTSGGDQARARTLATEALHRMKPKDAAVVEAWLAKH